MATRTNDLQAILEKVRTFEGYYALSQFPGGWNEADVGLSLDEIYALVEAGMVRLVRETEGETLKAGIA